MSGTVQGGLKARDANLKKNPNFYKEIGRIGGSNGSSGGFMYHRYTECNCGVIEGKHTKPMCSGKKGGTISRKKPSKLLHNYLSRANIET